MASDSARPGPRGAPAARAVCVLGCRVGSGAFQRRAKAAAEAFRAREATLLLACGGRAWDGRVEADELARIAVENGVPAEAIARERCSLDTRDNARFAAPMLERRGVSAILLVTCSWHLPRAMRLFRAACPGVDVEGLGVEPPGATAAELLFWRAREAISTWKDFR